MIKKTLYRVKHSNGMVSIGPVKPDDLSYTESYRLIADDGKVITDGTNIYYCIDTNEPDKYIEIDEPVENDINTEEDIEMDNMEI